MARELHPRGVSSFTRRRMCDWTDSFRCSSWAAPRWALLRAVAVRVVVQTRAAAATPRARARRAIRVTALPLAPVRIRRAARARAPRARAARTARRAEARTLRGAGKV